MAKELNIQVEKPVLPPLIKQSATYKMIVPAKVEEKIRYLIRKYPHTEWSGVLFIKHTGSFENNDLVITCEDLYPMDLGTTGWTEFKMNEEVTSYMAENIELFECDLALCHSHHSMGAFFSGQDTHTLQAEGNDTNCFVSLIVDTKGTYVAAITRKVVEKKELTTYYFGKSYEFFGDGEVKIEPPYQAPDVHQKMFEEERIEYFMLDVEVEKVNNPLSYLDDRFDVIESRKKSSIPTTTRVYDPKKGDTTLITNKNYGNDFDEDKDFYDWIHENRKEQIKEQSLFDNETMEELIDVTSWIPDPKEIHYLVCQLLTCSLIINKDIDLKQWIVRHMEKKYDEIFLGGNTSEFEGWADSYVEFIVNHYPDSEMPEEMYDYYDETLSCVAKAIAEEIKTYPQNEYLEHYIKKLENYIFV